MVDNEQPLQLVQSDRLSEAGTVPGRRQVENNTQPDRMDQMMTISTTLMQRQMDLDNKREEDRKQLLERQIELENRREENRKKEKEEELIARSKADEERKEKRKKMRKKGRKRNSKLGKLGRKNEKKSLQSPREDMRKLWKTRERLKRKS